MYYFSKAASHFVYWKYHAISTWNGKIMISLEKIFSKCVKRWEETEPVAPLQQEEKGAVLSHFILNKHMYMGICQHHSICLSFLWPGQQREGWVGDVGLPRQRLRRFQLWPHRLRDQDRQLWHPCLQDQDCQHWPHRLRDQDRQLWLHWHRQGIEDRGVGVVERKAGHSLEKKKGEVRLLCIFRAACILRNIFIVRSNWIQPNYEA